MKNKLFTYNRRFGDLEIRRLEGPNHHSLIKIWRFGDLENSQFSILNSQFNKFSVLKFLLLLLLLCNCSAWAQQTDTLKRTTLEEVRISESKAPSEQRSITPTQVVSAEKIEQLGALQVSDVLKHIAGVTLKDYGGVGGVKTVSARGLGSQFSTLTIDGVAVSDAQNGQIDLSRYTTGESAYISFSNGQQDNLLQTARSFAAGNVVNMETRAPQFLFAEKTNLAVGIDCGSFGLLSPHLQLERKLSDKLTLTLFANYLQSRGDYPFTIHYTNSQNDSSSQARREHSETRMLTSDLNLFYTINTRQHLSAKIHWMKSDLNLPGPVIFYTQKASESSTADLLFVQTKYGWKSKSEKWELSAVGKYQQSADTYTDTLSHLYNSYNQQEGYLSGTLLFHASKHLRFSLANDGALNALHSNKTDNNEVTRWTTLHVLAANAQWSRLTLSGNLLLNNTHERQNLDLDHDLNHWIKGSPYFGINLLAFQRNDTLLLNSHTLRLRYFFKENYRIPNFSELYFSEYHDQLRPEKALQHNIGLTYNAYRDSLWNLGGVNALLTADAYYNRVSDKIIAIPTRSMFLWTMMNLGNVSILGLDTKADLQFTCGRWETTLTATYSYQHATDRSDPEAKTYGHQIAYTPRHSGSLSLYVSNPYLDFGYNATFVGKRYSGNQNSPQNSLAAYIDQGIVLSHTFDLKQGELKLRAQLFNLLDVQYEIVKNYPMMGRNFRLFVSWKL